MYYDRPRATSRYFLAALFGSVYLSCLVSVLAGLLRDPTPASPPPASGVVSTTTLFTLTPLTTMGTQTYSSRFRVEPTAPSRGPGRITLHYDVYVPRADGRGSDVNTLANTMTERQARDLAQELLQAADAIAAEREIARLN